MAKKYDYETVSFSFGGKRYFCRGNTLEEAIEKKVILRRQLENGEIGISKNMTVKRWALEWLETYKKPNVTEKVYKDYLRKLEMYVFPSIGSLKLPEVTDAHLQKIINSLDHLGKSNTVKVVQLLKAMFRQARISRLIVFNPSEGLITPKKKEGSNRSITDLERYHLLAVANKHPGGLMIKTLLYCGLRPGEAVALDWRDIDFTAGRVNVSRAKESGSDRIKAPKSDAGIRSVPIPATLLAELKAVRMGPFDPVFTQQTTPNRHTETSLRCLWNSYKRQMDISMGAKLHRSQIIASMLAPDLTLYCLRHTYGTDLQKAGVPINIAKYLMGHSDISVTANVYTHTTDDMIDDAAAKINQFAK